MPITALAELALPRALVSIDAEAFLNDKSITGLVELPSKVESVGERAFAGSNIYAVDFPGSTTEIAAEAVQSDCLNYVIVRNPSAEIADNAFDGVNYIFASEGSTAQVYAYDSGIWFVSLDDLVLKDGFYYEVTDRAALLCAKDATGISGRLSIPDAIDGMPIETIYPNAFQGCEDLAVLELPDNTITVNGALDHLKNTQIIYRNTAPVIDAFSVSVSGSVDAGKSVLWSVRASSESGGLMYAFDLNKDGDIIAWRDFGTSNFYSAVLNEPGNYTVTVVCKDKSGLMATAESESVQVKNRPLTIVSVEAENKLYAVGEEIVWKVTTADGTVPVMYDYVLYRDGVVLDRKDMATESAYSYIASDAGEYELEVTCIDADETLCFLMSSPVQVYSAAQLNPDAPELIFANDNAPFAKDETGAPEYISSRIQLNWSAVEYAHSYTLELSKKQGEEWSSVVYEEGLTKCEYSLSASLFASLTEQSMYRLTLTSKGIQVGKSNTYYFSVIPVVIDETITVNGASNMAWNQSSRHAGSKEFVIDSDLPWEASSNADWVTWSARGDVLTLKMAERQDINGTRTASVTVTNGVNSAVITVRQEYNDFAPKLLAPQFSRDINNPTEMPVGDFRIGWEEYDYNYVRLRVYEAASNALAFELLVRGDYEKLTSALTGYTFKVETLYRFELAGVYSADYAIYEDEDDILKSQWYVYMTDEHHITLNNQENLAIEIVDEASIQVFATNFFNYRTDVDWLTVSASTTMSYDEGVGLTVAANTTGMERTGHVYFTCGSDTAVLTVNQPYIEPHIECSYALSTSPSNPTKVPYGLLPTMIYSVSGSWGTYVNGTYTVINEWDYSEDGCINVSSSNAPLNDYDVGTIFWFETRIGNASNIYYVKTDDSLDFYWISVQGYNRYSYDLSFPSHAFETTVKLRASASWNASTNSDWLFVSPTNGSKVTSTSGKQITISVTKNTTGKLRSGIVTFDCQGVPFYIYVTQSASSHVKVYDYDYYVSSSAGSGHTRIEYDPDTFYKHMDGAKGSLKLDIYSNDGFSAVCNTDWLTFSGGDSAISSTSSSKLVTVKLAENATGSSRTGTVTFSAGDTKVVVSITQEPKMSMPSITILNSNYTEGVNDEPGLLPYGEIEVQWNSVKGAEYYVVEHNWGKYSYRVNSNGASVYKHTIPKNVLAINSDTDVNISVDAYNQYGHSVGKSIWVYVVSDSAVLINGKPDAVWNNVDDLGEAKELTITSTSNWIASAPSWIRLSSSSGASGDTITATVLDNAGSAREGQIVFNVGGAQTVMPVRQCAALKDTAYLKGLPYSMDKGVSTMISADTSTISCSWDIEPQVDYYTLLLREVGGSRIIEIELEDGENSYTFKDLQLTPGSIYSIYFERWVVGRYRDGVYYYFQVAIDDPWILVDDRTSNYSELNADEDYEYFDVTCNGMWAAKSDEDWIMVYDESITQEDLDDWGDTSDMYNAYVGHSGDMLCISVLANTTGEARKGNVTITSGGATYNIPVTQYQSYAIAELTSPTLATKKSQSTTLPYGNVSLKWSAGSGVTGNYQVIVYESDTQSSGYDMVAYNSKKTSATSCTIPVSGLKEGYYYEVYLKTEVISGEYQRNTYYFHMGRENELTLTANLRSSSVSLGGNIGIDAVASGGAGNYVYTYILMKDGNEVMRSSAHRGITYYTFAISETGTYNVVVYVQDADGMVASSTTGTVTVGSAPSTPKPTVTPTPTPVVTLKPTVTPTPTATSTPGSNPEPSDDPTPKPTVSPTSVTIEAPVIDEDTGIIGSNGSVTIEWSTVTNAAGYTVWRSLSYGSGYQKIGTIDDSDICWWKDTNLEHGVEYFYRVQAVAADGTVSAFSNTFSITAVNTDKPLGGETVSISGSFARESYGVEIDGKALQLTGSVSCTGTTINRITINVKEVNDTKYERLMTRAFTDSQTSINLADYAEFQPDTTAYPFNEPGTYTLQLWASTASGAYATEPLATATLTVVNFDAKLHDGSGKTTKTIMLGSKWIVNGNVSVEGGYLGRVTVNAYATANSNLTDDFTAHSVPSAELQNWAAYTIDTTKEPFNKVGTYTLHVWAKDINGVGGSHSLAQMTVKVVSKETIPTDVYIKQAEAKTCTLASAVMMMRSRAYLSGSPIWSSITEEKVKPTAWLTGVGLYNNFTYNFSGSSMTVSYGLTASGMSVQTLENLLNNHHEGIVLYVYDKPHAILITDYEDGIFYCADPASGYSGKRIALEDSYMAKYYGWTQEQLLSKADKYWYIKSYSIDENAIICDHSDGKYIEMPELSIDPYYTYDSNIHTIIRRHSRTCADCNEVIGNVWLEDGSEAHSIATGVCICGYTPTTDEIYIAFVQELLENPEVKAKFDSWRNNDYSYQNTGHLLLEFTQDCLEEKSLSADSAIWKWKDALWGISSLGISTVLDWLKTATGNGDDVKQYLDMLEKSYLVYANLSAEQVNGFAEPWQDMLKVITTSTKWAESATFEFYLRKGKNFNNYTIDEIQELNDYANQVGENWPELQLLSKRIDVYKTTSIISSTGSLLFDSATLVSDLNAYSANKACFLAALSSASEEVIRTIDMMQEISDDKDFITAVYKFRQEYKAAVANSIQEYVISDTFNSHWTDIVQYGESVYNYFAEFLGGKIETSVASIIEEVLKSAKGYETKIFTTSSLLISTSAMVTDAILGTSETQRTVKAIDKMIRMKATLNARIDNDLIRFKYAQTAENARYVIADIMLLKSYQILGEQYALAYYEQQINKRAEFREADLIAWYQAGNAPWDYDLGAGLNEINKQARNEAEKIREIVRMTNISIDSFEFPFNETRE